MPPLMPPTMSRGRPGELVAAGGVELETLKGGDDSCEFLGGVDVFEGVHRADPCGFTDGVDEELDGAGV